MNSSNSTILQVINPQTNDKELPQDWVNVGVFLTYFGIATIVLGLVGNILTAVIVYLDTSLRISTRIFTGVLSVADSGVLLVPGVRYWILVSTTLEQDILTDNAVVNTIYAICYYLTKDVSIYTLWTLGVERFLIARFPTALWLKTRLLLKTVLVLVGILMASVAKNCIAFFNFYEDYFTAKLYAPIDMVLGGFVPFTGLIAVSGGLVYLLQKSQKQVQAPNSSLHSHEAISSNDSRLALVAVKMFLGVALVQVILGSPSLIFTTVINYTPAFQDYSFTGMLVYSLHWLNVSNSAWRFYIYWAFSYRFQRLMWHILTCGRGNSGEQENRQMNRSS